MSTTTQTTVCEFDWCEDSLYWDSDALCANHHFAYRAIVRHGPASGFHVDPDAPKGEEIRRAIDAKFSWVYLKKATGYQVRKFLTGERILEHRWQMQQSLGRPLLSTETVHHINGDRADNRIENLQLRHRAHGAGQSLRCVSCGSKNIEAVRI